jgi:hypothetical protein
MSLMNQLFHEYLEKFVQAFIDNILIYSQMLEEHDEHFSWYYSVYERKNCMGNCLNARFINQRFTT